jgi:hypothetical protein
MSEEDNRSISNKKNCRIQEQMWNKDRLGGKHSVHQTRSMKNPAGVGQKLCGGSNVVLSSYFRFPDDGRSPETHYFSMLHTIVRTF